MDVLDLDDLFAELRHRRWDLHFYGRNRFDLTAVVALHLWPDYADVLILRGELTAVAYRAPDIGDVLAPEWVTWWYGANALWTMRAVLTLEPPGPADQARLTPAPASCRIPATERRPVTIRLRR